MTSDQLQQQAIAQFAAQGVSFTSMTNPRTGQQGVVSQFLAGTGTAPAQIEYNEAWTIYLGNAALESSTLTSVDVPGAVETDCNDINNLGTVVGYYLDSTGRPHGFGMGNGQFASFDVPNSTATFAYGINDNNQIVGSYLDHGGQTHGFLLSNGIFTPIDVPGATQTSAWSINNAGTVVGSFVDASLNLSGFVDSNGIYSLFNAPNGARSTEVRGINNQNELTGVYIDSSGIEHGFTTIGNRFNDVSYPRAQATGVNRINDQSEIVGFDGNTINGPFSSYTRTGTKFANAVFPDAIDTQLRGLNNAGMAVGRYTDSNGAIHGLMGTP